MALLRVATPKCVIPDNRYILLPADQYAARVSYLHRPKSRHQYPCPKHSPHLTTYPKMLWPHLTTYPKTSTLPSNTLPQLKPFLIPHPETETYNHHYTSYPTPSSPLIYPFIQAPTYPPRPRAALVRPKRYTNAAARHPETYPLIRPKPHRNHQFSCANHAAHALPSTLQTPHF